MTHPLNVLFLCTGNSARSVLAEVLLDHMAKGRFKAFSAGSNPKGAIHPLALELIQSVGWSTEHLRSKSWDEFAAPGAPVMDFVFTVCDQAAAEQCPVWPGQPMTAHWGVPDPAAVSGSFAEQEHAFRDAFLILDTRIRLFTSLRREVLDSFALRRRLDEIGRALPETAAEPTSQS